jgi:hypothetical protein
LTVWYRYWTLLKFSRSSLKYHTWRTSWRACITAITHSSSSRWVSLRCYWMNVKRFIHDWHVIDV